MASFFLVVAFSLSAGALILFAALGVGYFRSRASVFARHPAAPDCLGHMVKRHCEYCSEECPLAARCALLVMDEYLRKHPEMLSSPDSSEQ